MKAADSGSLTRYALSEGSTDDYGQPSQSWSTSTISALVRGTRLDYYQTMQGTIPEVSGQVYIATDQAMNSGDKVLIGSDEYVMGLVEVWPAYKTFKARRRIQT